MIIVPAEGEEKWVEVKRVNGDLNKEEAVKYVKENADKLIHERARVAAEAREVKHFSTEEKVTDNTIVSMPPGKR